MARFGTFLYGSRIYGESGRVSAGSEIRAQVLDYGRIKIEIIAQDQPVSERWSYVLLRKNNGSSEEPADGAPIAAGQLTDTITTIVDEAANLDVSVPYGWTYYTLFVFDTAGQWIRDCATYLSAPNPLGSGKYMIDRLPRVLTSEQNNPIDPPDYDSLLSNFLGGLGVQFDRMRTSLAETLPERVRRVNQASPLHHVMAPGLGMNAEPGIGLAASARLFRQAGDIYRKKGTLDAVEAYVEALTGWTTVASESSNLLLDLDDASFETGVGGWVVVGDGMTLSTRAPDAAIPVPDTPYDYQLSPFARDGMLVVTKDNEPTDGVYLILRPGLGRTGQIPVTAGQTYYLSLYALVEYDDGTFGAPQQNAEVVWYDESRNEISATSPGSTTVSTAQASGWNRQINSFVAPAGARFCSIKITPYGGDKGTPVRFYYDRIQLSENDVSYQDPRSVNIVCAPRRVNLLTRPNTELGTFYWTADEGTVTLDSTGYVVGTYSLQFTPDATSGQFIAKSESIPATEGYIINLSGFFSGASCDIRINFYDDSDNLIDLRIPDETEQERTSTNVPGVSTAGDWNRVDIQALTPEGATSMRVVISGDGATNADLLILERSDRPQWYFDYVLADLAAEDAMYRDVAPTNRYSLLYPNRIIKQARIKQEIPNYLPLGVTARVLLWDSDDPAVTDQLPYGV